MTQLANNPNGRSAIGASHFNLAPKWARDFLTDAGSSSHVRDGIELTVRCGGEATLVSAIVRDVRVADGDAFRRRALDVYRVVREYIDATANRSIVRIWNHLPGIHDPLDAQLEPHCDRYMHFNAARFEAMCEWFNGAANIAAHVPAASGVGDEGNDLVVHALALREPGVPIENPRQIPAFRYSKKFGPLPPCFARATLIDSMLLISGTAAITGELSQHLGDLDRQWKLTLENLRVLIRTARPTLSTSRDPIHCIEDARIYVKRDADRAEIIRAARNEFPAAADSIEVVRADLCRAELLVEIEGVARL